MSSAFVCSLIRISFFLSPSSKPVVLTVCSPILNSRESNAGGSFADEVRDDGPVFGFDELADLAFALDHHAHRH